MLVFRSLLVLAGALPLAAQYAGPALLTRGEAPAAMQAPTIDFRPYLELNAIYDTGLATVAVTDTGTIASNSSAGLMGVWGLSGIHSWRHTKVGLDYHGSIDEYLHRTQFNQLNQIFLLGVRQELSRHTVLTLRQGAGTYSRDFTSYGLDQTVPFDPSTIYAPTTDFFDNRTYYFTSMADLVMQKTARLSFDLGGSGFFTRRASSALYGVTGAGAHADVQYRFSRHVTIGGVYNFTNYSYTNHIGGSDLHIAALSFAVRLSRWWEFSSWGGALRTETNFIQAVPIDPNIARLLGISAGSAGSEIIHRINWTPSFSARLSRTFSRGVFFASAGRSVTPGNGLFLTSDVTTILTGYTYTGLRRWSFTASGVYSAGRSIGNIIGAYDTATANMAVSRQVVRSFNVVSHYALRRYSSPSFNGYNRLIHEATLGIGFTPGSVPLRVW